MSDFVEVASLDDIPESNTYCTEVDDRYIVLVRVGEEVYCIDDVCTHDGGPLGEGELDEFCLVCPRHGAKFDVRNGKAVSMPATEPSQAHEVQVSDGKILVKFAD